MDGKTEIISQLRQNKLGLTEKGIKEVNFNPFFVMMMLNAQVCYLYVTLERRRQFTRPHLPMTRGSRAP